MDYVLVTRLPATASAFHELSFGCVSRDSQLVKAHSTFASDSLALGELILLMRPSLCPAPVAMETQCQ